MRKPVFISLIIAMVLVMDVLTKRIIIAMVEPYERIEILPFLNIVYVENKGAAFGMFAAMGNSFFITIAIIASAGILFYMSKVPKGLELFSISLILGGAVGNLIDRIVFGKVVDFIDFYLGAWHWPAFNVADSSLTVGIILFIISTLLHTRETAHE